MSDYRFGLEDDSKVEAATPAKSSSRFQHLPLTASHTSGRTPQSARRPTSHSTHSPRVASAMQEPAVQGSSIAAMASLYQYKRPMTSPAVQGRPSSSSQPFPKAVFHGHSPLSPRSTPPKSPLVFGESSGAGPLSPRSGSAMGSAAFSTSLPAFGQRRDLQAAQEKTMKAGMGDWDLQQSLSPLHPERGVRLLQGPLSPEVLVNNHGMSVPDVYQLYEVLNQWSTGFCSAVVAPIQNAKNREALLNLIVEAYAGLWDESVIGTVFGSSHTLGKMREMERLEREAKEAQHVLVQTKAENEALLVRLNEFVKRKVEDNLLLEEMRERAIGAEADLSMMGKAEEQFSLSSASAEVKLISMRAQLETAAAQSKDFMGTLSDRDAANARLKSALSESQSLAAKQYSQILDLQRTLKDSMRVQEEEVEASKEARCIAAQHPLIKAELECQLSDKQIALALLRSDLSVKGRDVEELRAENTRLQGEVQRQRATFETATKRIEVAESLADSRLKEKETWRAKMESLEAENQRQGVRIKDLVGSYWPLMARLKEAEAGHAAQIEVARCLEEEAVALRNEAFELREVSAEVISLRAKVEALEGDGEVPLDESALAAMSMDAARARAFVRYSRRKIIDLTAKVVSLLDVLAGAERRQAVADARALRLEAMIKQLEAQLDNLAKGQDKAIGADIQEVSPSEMSGDLQGNVQEMELWIEAVSLHCESLVGQLTSLMSKDPDHPRDLTTSLSASPPAPLGRLFRSLLSPSPMTSITSLINLDHQWEKAMDCVDRFVDWAAVLLDSKSRVAAQLDVQDSAQAAKQATERAEVMEEELKESKARIMSLEQAEVDLKRQLEVNEELKKSLEKSQELLATSSIQVASLTGCLALLEEEHFDTRTKLLLALEEKDGLMAVRDRAMSGAEEAREKETAAVASEKEHRVLRQALELDLVGCKAWIRGIEEAELQDSRLELSKLKDGPGLGQINNAFSTSSSQDITELLRSKTANAYRDKELAEENLRHKAAECVILGQHVAKLKDDLVQSEGRAARLKKEVWEMTLRLKQNEGDRKMALDSLIA